MEVHNIAQREQIRVKPSFSWQSLKNTIFKVKVEQGQFSFYLKVERGQFSFYLKVEQGQFSFYLFKEAVKEIQQAKDIGRSLYIPPKLLLRLLLNQLLHFRLALQSGLTFHSYYKQEQSCLVDYVQKDIVLRSSISPDGDVIHQFRRNFLQNPNCEATTSAHHWLTGQILSHFRTNLNLIAWELTLFVPACWLAWHLLKSSLHQQLLGAVLVLLVIGITGILWLIFSFLHYWLVNQFQRRFYISSDKLNYWTSQPTWFLVNLITLGNGAILQQKLLHFGGRIVLELLVPFFLAMLVKRFLLPKLGQLLMRRYFT